MTGRTLSIRVGAGSTGKYFKGEAEAQGCDEDAKGRLGGGFLPVCSARTLTKGLRVDGMAWWSRLVGVVE